MGVKLFTNLSFIIVCIPSVCIWSVLSYNIDTEQARIFSGPKTSYFGYTTVLTRNQDGIRLLVGAPNDNTGSGVNRTGSVYICDTRDEGGCTRFYNPGTGRTDSVHPSVYPITMEGFGSCLNQISNSKILMCAPRFKDLRFPTQAFVTGRCIITNADLRSGVNSSLPVEDEGKYADRVLGYIQGMAESGFSCDTLMPGTYVLGAPGLNTWRGGFAVIEGGNYADSIVDIQRQKQNMNDNLGFAVVGGHFCSNNRMCFAAGAPRFKHMGRVMLFERSVGNEVIQLLELTCPDKDSMGSYFGSVLCSADVNGDGWDDLLVGAPFYTKVDPDSEESSFPKDEGRVWIFISQKKELQDKSYFQDTPIMLSGSNTAFSRFGSSISNLGDVNGDGIDDIAVGAKDENGVGAVYIYHGSADGQIVEYSQRITGEMVSENITGFGAHVSKPLDVDDNGYPDIAIGCTNSDKAVLLRTRPIIDLVADLNFDSELINLNRTNCPAKDDAESCIVLILCFNYSQRSAPKQIEMDFNISVDILKRPSLRRVKIHTEDGFLDQISDKVLVERGRNKCKRFDLITLMEERLQDPFTAVRVQAQFKLNDSRFDPGEIKPIINQTRPSVLTKDTRFQLSCGEDNICEANLGIKGEFSFSDGDVFITINQTENINLDVRLENYGENSFGSKVNFYWNENLFYRTVKSSPRWPIGCADKSDEGQNYKLTCTVFPPINRNQAVNFSVLLEGDALSLNNAKVDVSIQAQTASAENNMENNVANFSSDVWIVASPDISGKSYPPELSVNTEEDTSLQNLTIIHKYLMINNGPSFLPATNVTVHLPYLYKTGEQLVESAIAKIKTESGEEVFCSLSHKASQGGNERPSTTTSTTSTTTTSGTSAQADIVTTQTTTESTTVTTTTTGKYPDIPDVAPSRRRRQTPNEKKDMDDNAHHLDCNNYDCDEMLCKLPGSLQPRESIIVNVTIVMNIKDLPFKDHDVMEYITKAVVLQPSHLLFLPWNEDKEGLVSTPIFREYGGSGVNIWIPIGSVIAALCLLVLLAIILRQCGFFKREKKAALQKWKRESGYYKRTSSRNPNQNS